MKNLLIALTFALLGSSALADESHLTSDEQVEYLWGTHAKVFEINQNCKRHDTFYTSIFKSQVVYYYDTDCVTRYVGIIQKYLDAASVADSALLSLTDGFESCHDHSWQIFELSCLDQAMEQAGSKIEKSIERITQKVTEAQHKNKKVRR